MHDNGSESGDIVVWGKMRNSEEDTIVGKFYSLLIEVFTRSRYTHVAVLDIVDGEAFIYEAALEGVRRRRLEDGEEVYIISMANSLDKKDLEFLDSKLGKPYSRIEAALSIFGLNFSTTPKWFCSELVHSYLTNKGYVLDKYNTPIDVISSIMINYSKPLRLIKF